MNLTSQNPVRKMPLSRHSQLRTTDLHRAEFEGTRAMSGHRLRPLSSAPFGASLNAAMIGGSTLVCLAYDGPLVLETTEPMEYFTLQTVLEGCFFVTTRRGHARIPAGSACVLPPNESLHIRFEAGTLQVAVKVPRPVLNPVLSRLGTERTDDEHVFDLTRTGPPPSWVDALHVVVATIDGLESGLINPVVGKELEHMLLTSLVLTQPRAGERIRLASAGIRGRRAAMQIAELIRRDPVSTPSVSALASEFKISTRTLQEGFRDLFGSTPTSYRREQRLDLAHERLCNPRVSDSVIDIALACGFSHPSRFASAYRERFGVYPSATLALSRKPDTAARNG